MRKSYRFVNSRFSSNKYLKEFLEKYDIDYQVEKNIDYVTFYLKSDMNDFDKIFSEATKMKNQNLIEGYLAPNTRIEYTKNELENADWLQIKVESRFHYAEPANMRKFEEIYYKKVSGCEECGYSYIQSDNIRMKKSIRFTGKRNIVGVLNLPNELFISEKVKELLENSDLQGFEIWPVYDTKKESILKNTFQLYIKHRANFSMEPESYAKKCTCKSCGRDKFIIHEEAAQYVYSKEKLKGMQYDIFKTKEELGASKVASSIIISHRFYEFLCNNKLDNELYFNVIRLVD